VETLTLYPIGLFLLNDSKASPTKMIAEPLRVKKGDSLSYIFLVNRFAIFYKIEGSGDKEFWDSIKIGESKAMNVKILNEKDSQKFIDGYLKKELRYR
jgi:hypothetical protein